ncbi:MAG: pyridoxamine 5'-phosphate oxidase family protein [Rhodobacteraceae bacterium]|nr:MAG: pyridoxamine 5'-phosphate oxidase family protein [Paracoccaceae bacterium]
MYVVNDTVRDFDEIRSMYPTTYESQTAKIIDYVDDHVRNWIEASTFLTLATVSKAGQIDVSPKGDPAGFVKVLDEKTLAIPDRPGNHRFDSFQNIFETGRIGLVFLVPNRNEVVRVSGSARVTRDADIREMGAIKGRVPELVILVDVEEAFYHCGKSIIRSRLWHPEEAGSVEDLPTYGEALLAHGKLTMSKEELDARVENNDRNRLYDE